MALPDLLLDIGFNDDYTMTPTTDITADLLSFEIRRGRNHELDKVDAGTATFILQNVHGYYWRNNTASPYYPFIRPGRYLQFSGTHGVSSGYLFSGFVESWEPGWLIDRGGLVAIMTLKCVDAFKQLGRYQLNNAGYAAQVSGTRIGAMLDSVGWPAGNRDIDAGVYTMQATGALVNQGFLDHIRTIEDSEGGIFFVAANGDVSWQDGNARQDAVGHPTLVTSQMTLADVPAGGEYAYILPEISDDDQYIYNQIRAMRLTGAEQVVNDALSQQQFGVRVLKRHGLFLDDDGDALTRATYLLSRFRNSMMRVKRLHILPQKDPANLFPAIFYDISTRVTVKLNSSDNPAGISHDYHIEAIDLKGNYLTGKWSLDWQLSDSDVESSFAAAHAGYVEKAAVDTYANVHDAALASTISNDPATARIGQYFDNGTGEFTVRRGGVEFDTSALGDTDTIVSAELWLYGRNAYAHTQDFDVAIVEGDLLANPLVAADYGDLLTETTTYGTINKDDWQISKWNRIEISAAGLALISKVGATRFGLRITRDINSQSPDWNGGASIGDERIEFDGGGGTYPPKLIVRVAR